MGLGIIQEFGLSKFGLTGEPPVLCTVKPDELQLFFSPNPTEFKQNSKKLVYDVMNELENRFEFLQEPLYPIVTPPPTPNDASTPLLLCTV